MSESRSVPPTYDSVAAHTSFSNQYGDTNSDLDTGEILSNRLNATRQHHVQTIIANHVMPILEHRTELGLSRTSIAFVPVNITLASKEADDDGFTKPSYQVLDIVSDHDGDYDIQSISLTSPIDTTQFWSQTAVVDELRRGLKERLNTRPDILKLASKIQTDDPPAPSSAPPTPAAAAAAPPKPRRFFSRRSSSKEQSNNTAPVVQNVVQNVDIAPPKPRELVTVVVQSEEICLRTQSDFGLYQTMKRPATVVRVQING